MLAIQRELYLVFHDPGSVPAPLLEHLVSAGYLGRKTQRGFRGVPADRPECRAARRTLFTFRLTEGSISRGRVKYGHSLRDLPRDLGLTQGDTCPAPGLRGHASAQPRSFPPSPSLPPESRQRGGPGGATAAPSNAAATTPSAGDDYYINYVAPRAEKSSDFDPKIDRKTGAISKEKSPDALSQAFAVDRKHAGGNPVTARELAKLEAKSLKTGKSPQQIKSSTRRRGHADRASS